MEQYAILCVDDEKIILDSLKAQIKKHLGDSYIYEFAESPDEALEVLDELQEDGITVQLVISDWLMPHMRGDEFLIKVHEKFPSITKIMLTGQAEDEAVERVKRVAKLHRCVSKPWAEQELLDAITTGLGIEL